MHGAGEPLIPLHGAINPDSFESNLAELAKGRQVIAVHLQAWSLPTLTPSGPNTPPETSYGMEPSAGDDPHEPH